MIELTGNSPGLLLEKKPMDNPKIPEYFLPAIGVGRMITYFPARKLNRAGYLVASLVLVLGAALVFLYGAYSAYLAYQIHGPVMIADKLTGPVFIALLLFGLGLLAGWGAYVNWTKGSVLYEQGFAYHDRKGLQVWRWEDILTLTSAVVRHYTNGIYTGTSHVYTLVNRQSTKLKLNDSIAKVEDLAKAIETGIFPLLYPHAIDEYNSGASLLFGPVAISKQGIAIGKRTYPWADVKQVSIHQGILKISKKDGGWFSGAQAAVGVIPNLHVLLAIISQVIGLKAG
jgi:hypothetical protein